MLAKINSIISPQGFEVIRARIWEILSAEIHNQIILNGDYEIEPEVTQESNSEMFDKEDLINVNISLANGKYSNKHQGSSDGLYQYLIDVSVKSKTSESVPGDYNSSVIQQKLMGWCRYILEDPLYKTLAFSAPYISSTMVTGFDIAANPNSGDMYNMSLGRLTFEVRMGEGNDLIIPNSIEGYDTQVTLNNTNIGYIYIGNSYP